MVKFRICPVCGSKVEDLPCEICEICNWEADWYQEEFPDSDAGPNALTLNQAREAYARGEKIL